MLNNALSRNLQNSLRYAQTVMWHSQIQNKWGVVYLDFTMGPRYRTSMVERLTFLLKNTAKLPETTMIFGLRDLKIGYGVTQLQSFRLGYPISTRASKRPRAARP